MKCDIHLHALHMQQERLDKRGTLIAGCMKKFLTNYWAARQHMLDAARAAELAKQAKKVRVVCCTRRPPVGLTLP